MFQDRDVAWRFFFFQAEDGIRDHCVTGVQTCALPISFTAEGPTTDPAVNELRERQKRNLAATLLLSQGVPMIVAGDECGRTQQGNNNAYCQDNETNWVDWYWDEPRWAFLNFVKRMVRMRREHPIFRRRAFFHGVLVGDIGRKDAAWLKPDGQEMTPEEWEKDFARCLGVWLHGEGLPETNERGHPLTDAR